MQQVDLKKYEEALSVEKKSYKVIEPYNYKGFGLHPSQCKVEIWEHNNKAVILFTEVSYNKGTSVTNACEQLVQEIYSKFLSKYKQSECLFIETYHYHDNYDVIVPDWKGNVNWFHLGTIKKELQ